MERLFVDTSVWFAYVYRDDPDHQRVRVALSGFEGRLVTSNFVFDETVTLCRFRAGHEVAATVGGVILDPRVVDLVRVTADDEPLAWSLFVARSDKDYSYTDCTSFVVMRRLGLRYAASLDDDFRREGFELLPPALSP